MSVIAKDAVLAEQADEGETISIEERLVLAPSEGRFWPLAAENFTAEGEYVIEGQQVGRLVASDGSEVGVYSSFSGWVMGLLVPPGSPVKASEPVVWLRRL